ncbi:hypothetical protein ACFQ7B_05545 [Streptomyces erythrochromogenes]|uniref:hypothetical protein n=1 Tax=Streptomyces erythrochromogenes TaxID=285574 RepID=UPI0036CA55C9
MLPAGTVVAGTAMNPMRCPGQVEGGVAHALGATLFTTAAVRQRIRDRARGGSA